jgi:hypothetical protein
MNPLKNSKGFTLILVLLSCLLWSCQSEQAAGDIYEVYQLSGFEVRVEKTALDISPNLTQEAIERLEYDLGVINNLGLNTAILAELQSVVIFLDWNTGNGTAFYHPSLDWLIENGYAEEKYRNVEISNVNKYLARTDLNHPYIVLHELAHAYHHRVLGPFNESITEAYNNALANGLYRDVTFDTGTAIIPAPFAYAHTNEREYFAELTETYFGWNAYFPFVRTELEMYDPVGYDLIESAWEQ